MAGDGGTAEGALIARRRDYNHTAPDGLIERLFQRLFPFGGRLCKGKAQVDHSRAGADTFDDRRGKLLGRRAGICSLPVVFSAKMGRTRRVQSGQMAGAGEFRFADKMPATKVPCRHAVLLA